MLLPVPLFQKRRNRNEAGGLGVVAQLAEVVRAPARNAARDLDERDANRKLYVQALDATSGARVSSPIQVQAKGNRYQDLRPFPDGSVAYVSAGNSTTTLKIVRVLACQ